jgi:hypothetical protein
VLLSRAIALSRLRVMGEEVNRAGWTWQAVLLFRALARGGSFAGGEEAQKSATVMSLAFQGGMRFEHRA